MTKAEIETAKYQDRLPEGWCLEGVAEWDTGDAGLYFTLSATNRELDATIKLRFRNGTTIDAAVERLGNACTGFHNVIVWGDDRG